MPVFNTMDFARSDAGKNARLKNFLQMPLLMKFDVISWYIILNLLLIIFLSISVQPMFSVQAIFLSQLCLLPWCHGDAMATDASLTEQTG